MDCKVCNSFKICGHNHYGADCICHSCRGFFLRAVQSSYYQIFQHNKNNNCIIDSKNRKSCKKCRFEKCLQVGMKIAFVQKPVSKSGKSWQTIQRALFIESRIVLRNQLLNNNSFALSLPAISLV